MRSVVKTSPSKARLHISLAVSMMIAGLIVMIATVALVSQFLLAAERLEWRLLGSVDELQRGEPVLLAIDNHEFYLIWVDMTPIALSTRDPHRGICKIRWFEQERYFADPCGGTVYRLDGTYRNGPSPRSMDQFALRVIEGRVEVNVNQVTLGRDHT
jgi:hypothetical protein